MSSEQVNIIIGVGQLLFAACLFFGIDFKRFARKSTLSDITLTPRRTMTLSKAVLVLIFGGLAFSGYGFYRTFDHPRVTTENIETKVREWLDAFGFGTTKLSDSAFYFAFQVNLPNGVPLGVGRSREHDHYLTLSGKIEVSQQHRDLFAKLAETEKLRFIRELRLESAKSKIAVNVQEEPFKTLTIVKLIPITDNLTEATLIEDVREMNYEMFVITDTIALRIEAIASK